MEDVQAAPPLLTEASLALQWCSEASFARALSAPFAVVRRGGPVLGFGGTGFATWKQRNQKNKQTNKNKKQKTKKKKRKKKKKKQLEPSSLRKKKRYQEYEI